MKPNFQFSNSNRSSGVTRRNFSSGVGFDSPEVKFNLVGFRKSGLNHSSGVTRRGSPEVGFQKMGFQKRDSPEVKFNLVGFQKSGLNHSSGVTRRGSPEVGFQKMGFQKRDSPEVKSTNPNHPQPWRGRQIPKSLANWLLVIAYCLVQLVIGYWLLPRHCRAQSFSSSSYKIQWGNFNMTAGRKSSANYQLTDTVGQNAPGQYDNLGYTVKAGFQYIYDTFTYFSFQIDDLAIELGTLSAGATTTDSNIIAITTPSGQGYQIMVHQNHPLAINNSGTTIPDTVCDNGNCTESQSAVWSNLGAYGFGFNAIGINSSGVATHIGTSAYFGDQTYYRQFADYSATPAETNQIIMAEDSAVNDRQARITYKVNISSLQSAGDYQNAITFTAIPKY